MDTEWKIRCAERLTAMEGQMKTMQAEYKTDIARLAEDNAKREMRLVVMMVAIVGVAVAAATAVLGTMIAVID